MKWLLVLLALFGRGAFAEPPTAGSPAYNELLVSVSDPACRDRLKSFSDLRLIPDLPASGSDFLVKLILEMEQDFESICPGNEKVERELDVLKRAYLGGGLGLDATKMSSAEVDVLFRGLLATLKDRESLKQKIAALKDKPKGMGLLARLYGSAVNVDSIVVLGARASSIESLKKFLSLVCEGGGPCPFWDSYAIDKVLITPQKGIAAYLPETAVLILSEEVLESQNLLTRVVLLHELAHAAEKRAWFRSRRRWIDEFAPFSGWTKSSKGKWSVKAEKLKTQREDELTRLSASAGSSFSILPDPVILGKAGDGFVLAKGYTESLANNDPSEDLADSIAVYRFAPERFCFKGKKLAPRKFEWIARNAFPKRPAATCN